jgi:hypothetical protein
VKIRKGGTTVSAVALAPIFLAKAMPCSTAFPASADPSVGNRMLVYLPVQPINDCGPLKQSQHFVGQSRERDEVRYWG